jgi:glutathione synthase/RimK-type ligase-like ATP-grasp enzyme
MKVAILRNEDSNSSLKWELACSKKKLNYTVINLTSSNWLKMIKAEKFHFFLLKPPGLLTHYKTLYDERLFIIAKILKFPTFPSFEEVYIYENKKLLSYFLEANHLPHPKTYVFYLKQEAKQFVLNSSFPIVAKTSIGASGSGVQFLKNKKQALKYIKNAFSAKGIRRRLGPNRVTGSPGKWITKAIEKPSYFVRKLKEYFSIYKHGERDFLVFQEYIPHDFEWRIVRIGDSYFGHKKIKSNEKASGSKGIDYSNPSESILNFTRNICEKYNFHFMALDVFEDGQGGYLINEMQTIFGHVQDHILEVNGIPGRYILKNSKWVFEKGYFNTNESYDLILESALDLLKKNAGN